MKKQLGSICLLLIMHLWGSYVVKAQTAFASEEELKTQALKLFDDDEFEEAYPLYSQLASLYPKDPNYNYRLGVCMLYASDDKEKAIPFLEFASKKPDVEKESFFYLAKAYHLNYRFDEAIAQYEAYKRVATEAKAEKLRVERQIEMCRNGKKLLRNLTDLVVIDKKEMSRVDFFRSYDISDIGGKLLVKPDEAVFKSAIDKKKKEKSIIYLASNNNQVYFSSYGDDPERGKDIYLIRKLPNGAWSKAQTLGYPVNTEYDEDYPFLHPNGKVLYFCSKGQNSMGGYDIFKTTLNEETNTWNKPVNLDFPINTPDDDVLYVTNGDEKEAYFSSARSSATGKTSVYHINVERKPIDVAIIKGAVVKNRDNQALDVKITVKDLGDNSILGIYNSKAESGSYLINLPNGGKFMYTVEAAGFATQSEMVVLPTQYVFKPLKQEISYETGTDKLIVKNLFDEPVDDASYMLALNFIKDRSKMDVNENDASTTIAATTTNDNEIKKDVTTSQNTTEVKDNTKVNENKSLSNDDIIKIAYGDANDAEKEAKDLQEQADIALTLANQKSELAQNKTIEATQLMNDAAKMDDNIKKQATIDEAKTATNEADILNQETVAAFNIAKKIGLKAISKDQEAELSLQYAKDLEAAIKSKDPEKALVKLDEQEKMLEELGKRNGNAEPDNIFSGLKLDESNKKRELDKVSQASNDIYQEIEDNKTLIGTLQADADQTKKEDLKKGLLDQIAALKEENIEKLKELEQNEAKVALVEKEYKGIKNELALVTNVVDRSKTSTSEEAAAGIVAIDKTKLEKQVNEIKNSTADIAVVNTNTNSTAASTEVKDVYNTTAKTNNDVVKVNTNENKTDATTEVSNNTSNETNVETKVDYVKEYNDGLAATDNIKDELERETQRAVLYKNWTNSISDELIVKKQELKTEKNKDRKKELSKEISALEVEQKEKQAATNDAVAGIEKIKTQQAVAVNEVKDNTPVNNTAVNETTPENKTSENSTSENKSTNEAVVNNTERPVNINKQYTEQLGDIEKIPNTAEREQAKANALKKWSEAINADIAKKKQDMEASSDPEMKALLALKISDAEQLSKEKSAEADRILNKTNTAIATNTSTENKTTDIAVTPTTNTSTENKTTDIAVTPTTNTPTENKTTEVDVTPTTNTTENKTTDVAVTPTTNTSTENKITDVAVTPTTNTSTENKTTDVAVTPTTTTIQPGYAAANAKEQAGRAEAANKKADELLAQANDLKSEAGTKKKQSEKDELVAQADVLIKEAETKKSEAAQLTSEANLTEFMYNQVLLDQLVAASSKLNSDEISIAEMMKDEAKIYFDKAQKSIALAAASESNYDKEAAMEDAAGNEKIALEKQKKAIDIYKKNNPDFVASTTNITTENNTSDVAVTPTTNTSTENKTTDVAVTPTTNTSAENKTTDVAVTPTTNTSAENKTKDVAVTPTINTTTENKTTDVAVTPTTNTATENKTTDVAITPTTNNTTEIVLAPTEKFERSTQPVYSASKPIPVNAKLPEGLVFKVQIGAFRNPIAPEVFTGMSPINAETTPQGLTRYTAGLFTKFSTADNVKNEIKTLGYRDAFVVAFLNGKRISMTEAQALVGGNIPAVSNSAVNNTTANNTAASSEQNTATNIQQPAINSDQVKIAETQNVTTVGGLFYTVQVGVYSQPVTAAKLFNCRPLNSERTANGAIRYSTGIYNNVGRANEAKDLVVNAGIKDAFVSAYYNGKRISMAEAASLMTQGSSVFSAEAGINALPTFGSSSQPQTTSVKTTTNTPSTTTIQPETTTTVQTTTTTTIQPSANSELQTTTLQNNTMPVDSGVVFKVQIGAFKDEVPLNIANNFLKIAKKGIKNYKDENGLTVYTVGVYKNYEDANVSKTEVISQSGVSDAFIVAYKDGKKISIEEAMTLIK